MGRLGSVEDLFEAVRFLVEEGSYIAGRNFFVNGAQFMQ
jgi:hypothetical protein